MERASLDRAMQASFRQLEIRTEERFRCKEPLAIEFSTQLKEAVPSFCSDDANERLQEFARDIKSWLDDRREILDHKLGESILSPTPNCANKPQPYFTEAVFATLIRCEVVATYAKYLKMLDMGAILGGSVSYGKFFNVRQSQTITEITHQSDIDILLVADLEELAELIKLSGLDWSKVANIALQHKAEGNKELLDDPLALVLGLQPLINLALTVMKEERLDKHETVITKKFRTNLNFQVGKLFFPEIQGFPFLLSIHIITPRLYELLTNPPTIEEYGARYSQKTPEIVDLRVDSDIRDIMVYGTMEGTIVPESVSRIHQRKKTYKFGYENDASVLLCKVPPYFYWQGRFVSGTYQNLIIPAFEVVCDNKARSLKKGIISFQHFLSEEALREKAQFRDSNLSLSKLHPRHPIFLSTISESLDRIAEKQITSNTNEIINSYTIKQSLGTRKSFHDKYNADFSLTQEVIKEIQYYYGDKVDQLNILDLGCGTGAFLYELSQRRHQGSLVGIDLVPVEMKPPTKTQIDFIVGDIKNLTQLLYQHSYGGRSFNVILAMHVLYHVPNVSALLETITQWLSADGVFITTANSNHNLLRLGKLFGDALFKIGYNFSLNRRYTPFSADNATQTMREYFRFVRHTITETDITITNMDDVVDYLESTYDNYGIPESIEVRGRLTDYIRESLDATSSADLIDRRIVSVTSGKKPIRYINHRPELQSY
ncbi:MAG: methyltransferase type 11 [Acidobacteria bacterium]|nr:methyltransferase type 11 [Acidobacteriota bacterium]